MPTFLVTTEQTVATTYRVVADNAEQARARVHEKNAFVRLDSKGSLTPEKVMSVLRLPEDAHGSR